MISPNFEFLHNWCSIHKVDYRDNRDLIENEKIIARYQEEVERINATCDKTRRVKKFELVCESWTPETGELSPTLKLKRRIVKAKYKAQFDKIYGY